ncbi:hypothetical protein ECTW15901_1223, partial [Escherichia coli TW15901]
MPDNSVLYLPVST